eukprot:TRINITY_DN2644_c0_g1_i1.p1 TRINITY_DN2644_c0_g1~~TRINITY_DN2644_c0_g1_i1.p1  ORF type:complete len:634 (-),score=132.24 TRINITY_DN2644_c0_g1_i1:213-1868(-)
MAQAPRQHATTGFPTSQVRDGGSPSAAAAQLELQARVGGSADGRGGLQDGSAGQRESQTPGKGAEQSGYRVSDSNGVRVDGNGAGPSSNGGNPGPSNGTVKDYSVGDKVAALASFDQSYHMAEVIERRKHRKGGQYDYYIHYLDQNKRLDEWLPPSKVEPWTAAEFSGRGAGFGLSPLATPGTPGYSAGDKADPFTPGGSDRKLTRNLKRKYDAEHHVQKSVEDLPPIDQSLEKAHEEKTKMKNIQQIVVGKHAIDTWYYSPYPDDYASELKLYICEYCLKYMRKAKTLQAHLQKCTSHRPPGEEIYHADYPIWSRVPKAEGENGRRERSPAPIVKNMVTLSMYEVDGVKNKVYCQNLCLLAKLFLDHKTLYYDVDPFLFYVLTECDEDGHHIVGYFSKEKHSAEEYNLACIMTLPPYQRNGYGRFLIAFSYELSRKEGKVGTPERPLSDLGQVSFRSYWMRVILETIKEHRANISVKDISALTAIKTEDIVATLQPLNLIKYWKGQHIISATVKLIDEHLKAIDHQPLPKIESAKLTWTPPASPALKKPR